MKKKRRKYRREFREEAFRPASVQGVRLPRRRYILQRASLASGGPLLFYYLENRGDQCLKERWPVNIMATCGSAWLQASMDS